MQSSDMSIPDAPEEEGKKHAGVYSLQSRMKSDDFEGGENDKKKDESSSTDDIDASNDSEEDEPAPSSARRNSTESLPFYEETRLMFKFKRRKRLETRRATNKRIEQRFKFEKAQIPAG